MIPYSGNFAEDATVYIIFNTFTSNDPSASCTITNFINTDVHIHKDDGLTQRNNAAGITVSVDFDGITGSHMIKIDTNDNTVADFWVIGHDYFVRIEGATIDGATINAVVGHFSIENRYNPVTDYDGPTKAEMDTAHALLATEAKQDIIDTNVDQIETAVITNAAGTDIAADIIAVKAQTVAIEADTDVIDDGTSGLVKIASDVAAILTDTGSTLDTLIKDIPTNIEFASLLGALNTAANTGDPAADVTVMGYVKQLINILIGTAGIAAFPAEQAPANAVSLAEVIRAIHADVTGLNGSAMIGTNGANTTVPDAAGVAPTAAEIKTAMEAEGTSDLDAIADAVAHGTYGLSALQVLIAALQTDLDNGTDGLGALKTLIDACSTHDAAAVKTALEADGAKLDHLWEMTEDDAGVRRLTTNALEQAPSGGLNAQETRDALKLAPTAGAPAAGSVDKHLDDTVEDTNELQTNQSNWATATTVALSAQGKLDVNAECDAALTDYGANTTVPPTTVEIQTEMEENGASILDTLRDDLADGGRLDLLIDAIKAKTDNLPSGIAKNVAMSNFEFLMIDSTDHVSAKTGLTITAQISKDGGAFVACTNNGVEISGGLYKIDLTQAEMNADVITLKFTASGADQRTITIVTG